MKLNGDIDMYEKMVTESTELFPYRYFVTSKFPNWSIENRLGKSIEEIALSDMKLLARRNRSHIYPLIGFEHDHSRNCHYHAVILSQKELDYSCFDKFDDGRDLQTPIYDNDKRGLFYIMRKHIPYFQREIIHPRMRVGCSSHSCEFSRWLRAHIPKF